MGHAHAEFASALTGNAGDESAEADGGERQGLRIIELQLHLRRKLLTRTVVQSAR